MVEDIGESFVDIANGNIDLYRAYLKNVEQDFVNNVDEMLENFNMCHLRVKA